MLNKHWEPVGITAAFQEIKSRWSPHTPLRGGVSERLLQLFGGFGTRKLGLAFLALSTMLATGSPIARFSIKHWNTGDGLPQHSVISTIQTRDGYLWVGTLDGLARFDGVHFEKFYDANTPGLNSTRIVYLFEDSHTNFWIGTENGGIIRVDREGRVSRVDLGGGAQNAHLVSMSEGPTGDIWLRLANGFTFAWRDGRALSLGTFRGFALEGSNKVWAVVSGPSGTPILWGLRLSPSGFQNVAAQENEILLKSEQWLMSSLHGGYWLIADGEVKKYRDTQVVADYGLLPGGTNTVIFAACEDYDGNLILGTDGKGVLWFQPGGGGIQIASHGILRFNTNGVTETDEIEQSDLTHNTILSVCMDREGNLWAGTDGGGLNRITRKAFGAKENGRTIFSTSADTNGSLWVVGGRLLACWHGSERKSVPLPYGIYAIGDAVFADHEQHIWTGIRFGPTADILQLKGDSLKQAGRGVPGKISVIYEDNAHRLWFGARGVLDSYANGKWTRYGSREGLSSSDIQAIAEDRDGSLWIGTGGGGLQRFKEGRFSTLTKADGLPSDNIGSLYVDTDGVLWAGTTGGLVRMDNGKITRWGRSEGLLNDRVGYILEDSMGCLWLGSTAGLSRVQKRALTDFAHGKTNDVFFRVYGEADGLPSAECTLDVQPGASRTANGTLWFPTIKGLALVNPAELLPNTNPPPVRIEAILMNGELQTPIDLRAPAPSRLEVPPEKESVEIRYASINLSAPLAGKFRYRMKGYETGWTERRGDVRFARYSRLAPGDYTFEVKACNEDGIWNETGATLAVKVLPPFWQTWWFRTVVTLVALGLVAGVVYYVSTQRLQRQVAALRQQEALERERARIARDLHDQLGANLTQVALLGEMAETDKDLPDEVEAHARQIAQTARETTHSLDEIVWTVNPSNDTLDGLINYVCKYAQEYLALAGLKYRLDVPSQLPNTPISPELRHNVFLAAKESINNIVKHAAASSAWLRLQLEPESFTLEIEDDGKGLSPDAESKGRSGLKNMRKRMEDIGGRFEVARRDGGGTVIRLVAKLMPVG
jgi:signal transduction histidine kinase/ligand-binding sensor domain-containing protein